MRGRKEIGHRIGAIITNAGLKSPKLSKLALDTQTPIKFITPNGVMAFGFEGQLVIDYCKALLELRRSKALAPSSFVSVTRFARTSSELLSNELFLRFSKRHR